MVTSNLFGRWGETFSDAEVLTLAGATYRTRARREPLAKDRTTND